MGATTPDVTSGSVEAPALWDTVPSASLPCCPLMSHRGLGVVPRPRVPIPHWKELQEHPLPLGGPRPSDHRAAESVQKMSLLFHYANK